MSDDPDPWTLPGPGRWLQDLVARLDRGLCALPADPGRPPGVEAAVRRHLPSQMVDCRPRGGQLPAAAVAEVFGTAPTLEALLNPALDHDVALVLLGGIGAGDVAAWSVFLDRFAQARAAGGAGPALLVADPPPALTVPNRAVPRSWRADLRRGDRVIWAEEHLPPTRDGLAADLAVLLAVDVCVWRLDLAAALVRAGLDDLADPGGWLARRAEPPIPADDPHCPLALLAAGRTGEMQQRIWKAQLAALFPVIENHRLDLIATHHARLRLDDHLRGLGVAAVEEIELGALRFQLRRYLTRPQADWLDLLVRARNALAHRQPVAPEDALQLLKP